MVSVTTTSEEKVLVTLNPQTAAGNPAELDGPATWTVIEGDATLEVAENGLSCVLISGAPGVINQIKVSADADLDAGEVREISEVIVYTVTAPEASNLGVTTEVFPK